MGYTDIYRKNNERLFEEKQKQWEQKKQEKTPVQLNVPKPDSPRLSREFLSKVNIPSKPTRYMEFRKQEKQKAIQEKISQIEAEELELEIEKKQFDEMTEQEILENVHKKIEEKESKGFWKKLWE